MIFQIRNGRTIGVAPIENNLYILQVDNSIIPDDLGKIAAPIDFDDPIWKVHRRLRHLGLQSMLKLLQSSEGMNLIAKQIKAKIKAICPVCVTTRALVEIPRDPANRNITGLGQLMHANTWGPYPIEGYDILRYFLFITDDFIRYTWGAPFTSRSDLLELFRGLYKKIERRYNFKIRTY